MISSHGHTVSIEVGNVWAMSLGVAKNLFISKSFFHSIVPPSPEEFTPSVSDRSHICLLFCVGGFEFGDLCLLPLAPQTMADVFSAEAQTVFETSYFLSLHLCSFCSFYCSK